MGMGFHLFALLCFSPPLLGDSPLIMVDTGEAGVIG